MTSSIESLTFTVPLTAANRAQAQQFAQQMPVVGKAAEVERTLLAIIATQYYLQLLGFTSDLTTSHSWNLLHQWTGSPADLVISNGRRLHCCPIETDQVVISLPKADDGLGYVVVELSDDFQDAKMLGFAPSSATQQITRNQLQSLDALVDSLTANPVENLYKWLDNQMSEAWGLLDDILTSDYRPALSTRSLQLRGMSENASELYRALRRSMPATEDALVDDLAQLIQQLDDDELRWQVAEMLWNINRTHPANPVILTKDIGFHLSGHAIGLEIGLLPKGSERFLILVRLRPIGESPSLPQGLQFSGYDEHSDQFFTLSSRENDAYVQYKFNASLGDGFSLRVHLGDAQVVETFTVQT